MQVSPARGGRATRALGPRPPASQHNPVTGRGTGRGVISPPRSSWSISHLLSACGWATGTSLPVRVRVRRVGAAGRASAGPGGQVLPLWFRGPGPGPKLACLIPSPSSRDPGGGHTSDSIPEPQRSGLRCRRFRRQGGACGVAAALSGQGQRAPLTAQAPLSLRPIAGPAAFSHTLALGRPAWAMVLPPARPGPASLTSVWMPVPARRSLTLRRRSPGCDVAGENAQHC